MVVQNILSNKEQLNSDQLEDILFDVQQQSEILNKALEYSRFLLDNAQNTKEELNVQQNLNMILEQNTAQMRDQVVCMQEDWKREQSLVLQLENDVQFKDNQILEAFEASAQQRSMIEALNAEIQGLRNKITGMVPRATKKVKRPAAKGKKISPAGSLSSKKLEELLL